MDERNRDGSQAGQRKDPPFAAPGGPERRILTEGRSDGVFRLRKDALTPPIAADRGDFGEARSEAPGAAASPYTSRDRRRTR
jgi:hypothetical protein